MYLMILVMVQIILLLKTKRKQGLWVVSKASAREVLQQIQAAQVAGCQVASRRG